MLLNESLICHRFSRGGKNHQLKLYFKVYVSQHECLRVRRTHTLCLRKDYPVSAALGWKWNRLLHVQMFHVLSRGSVICWILCFSLPHPVILQNPYRWVFLLRLTFVPLASYRCTGAEDPGQSERQGRSLPLKSGALAVDQLVLWEKVPLKCGGTEDVRTLWLTLTIYRVKKKKKRMEVWNVRR